MIECICQSKGIDKMKEFMCKNRATIEDIDPLIQLKHNYKEYFNRKSQSNTEDIMNEILQE